MATSLGESKKGGIMRRRQRPAKRSDNNNNNNNNSFEEDPNPHSENQNENKQKEQDDMLTGSTATSSSLTATTIKRKRENENNYEEEEYASPTQKTKVEPKIHSAFVELRRTLIDSAAVADFITQNHETKLRDGKQMNTFFQAISNCSEELFTSLCQQYKTEVHIALERIFELHSVKKVAMTPAIHEFVIRCEQNGVRKSDWASNLSLEEDSLTTKKNNKAVEVDTNSTTKKTVAQLQIQLPLLSPRELIKKIALIDPRGRLERMIEMCNSMQDLHTCAKKLQSTTNTINENDNGEVTNKKMDNNNNNNNNKKKSSMDYADICQLVSKLASKTRRISAAALTTNLTSESTSSLSLLPTNILSQDDSTALHAVLGILISVTEYALTLRPPSAWQQPIARLSRLVHWCESNALIAKEEENNNNNNNNNKENNNNNKSYAAAVAALESQATQDLSAQAKQLETVLILKALPPGDEAAAEKALKDIWNSANGYFDPSSPDVLSSIAVLASAKGLSDVFRRQVSDWLLLTYKHRLQNSGLQLPRRALNFVNAEQSKEKQEAIKRMLAAQEKK